MTRDHFSTQNPKTILLIPVMNDWEPAAKVLAGASESLSDEWHPLAAIIVDDFSTEETSHDFSQSTQAFSEITVLRLRRNLGHQRAIAIGLAFLVEHFDPSVVVIMDGDGEDKPDHVPLLLEKLKESGFEKIVFAERRKRFDPVWFRACYHLYRFLHRILTGIPVRVGNFSAIPRKYLGTLSVVSELWNHYAAATFKSKIPVATLPLSRGVRLGGKPKMRFTNLVLHGLGAISVFGETVAVRVLLFVAPLIALTALLLVFSFVEFGFHWLTLSLVTALLITVALALTAIGGLFFFLHARNGDTFLPARDYEWFVEGFRSLPRKAE